MVRLNLLDPNKPRRKNSGCSLIFFSLILGMVVVVIAQAFGLISDAGKPTVLAGFPIRVSENMHCREVSGLPKGCIHCVRIVGQPREEVICGKE